MRQELGNIPNGKRFGLILALQANLCGHIIIKRKNKKEKCKMTYEDYMNHAKKLYLQGVDASGEQ